MPEIIILKGEEFEKEKELIEAGIREDPIFVLDSEEHDPGSYLEVAHDLFLLKSRTIMRMRLCRELFFKDRVVLVRADAGKDSKQYSPDRMSELLTRLNPDESWRIIILDDDRQLLAEIAQQLACLNYPPENIELQLDGEAGDAERMALFIENLAYLAESLRKIRQDLEYTQIVPNEPGSARLEKILRESRRIYEEIDQTLGKAYELEMRVGIASSQKSGKSAIVNSILKQKLAPTACGPTSSACQIYRQSPDDKYHLYCDGEEYTFSGAGELFLKMSDMFSATRSDKAARRRLGGMEIGYVPKAGKLENFTIYEIPANEVEGAAPDPVANEALKECDALIFVMDFEKWPSASELAYLKELKMRAAGSGKFHTLILVLNKMDRLLEAEGAQSRTGAIERIRRELTASEPQFSSCIVFPVSALGYCQSLELEHRANREERLLPLLADDCDCFIKLREIAREISGEGEDEELRSLLFRLESETTKMADILGGRKISLKDMRQYSGMPQLLKYLTYITHGKAREEILNSISIDVDLQMNKLKAILEDHENLARLRKKMEENAQQVDKIKNSIRNFSQDAKNILSPELTEKDYEALKGFYQVYGKYKAFLDEIQTFLNDEGQAFPLPLEGIFMRQRRILADFSEREMQEGLWRNFVRVVGEHIARLEGRYVLEQELELDSSERKNIFEAFASAELEKKSAHARAMVLETQIALSFLMDYRISELRQLTKLCRQELEKDDPGLIFPHMPEFSANFSSPEINATYMEIEIGSVIAPVFESLGDFYQTLRNIFRKNPMGTREYEIKSISHAQLEEKLKPIFHEFCGKLKEGKVYEKYQMLLFALANNMKVAQSDILDKFIKMNLVIDETVRKFAQLADDSEELVAELESGRRMLVLVNRIKDVSSDFVKRWNHIVGYEDSRERQEGI